MLIEVLLAVALLGLLLFLGGFFYYRDRLFLKKRTREALGFAVRKELSVERTENKKKRELFIKTMEQLQSSEGTIHEDQIKKD